jgi:hypothetical protein
MTGRGLDNVGLKVALDGAHGMARHGRRCLLAGGLRRVSLDRWAGWFLDGRVGTTVLDSGRYEGGFKGGESSTCQ